MKSAIKTNYVYLSLMYRDAANYKICETYSFLNDEGLSDEQINNWFEAHLVTEEVLAVKYGLPNLAAGTYMHDLYGEYDHCFMEINDWGINSDVEGVLADNPFSVIYHAMVDDKGVAGYQQSEESSKKDRLMESLLNIKSLSGELKFTSEEITRIQALISELNSTLIPSRISES